MPITLRKRLNNPLPRSASLLGREEIYTLSVFVPKCVAQPVGQPVSLLIAQLMHSLSLEVWTGHKSVSEDLTAMNGKALLVMLVL